MGTSQEHVELQESKCGYCGSEDGQLVMPTFDRLHRLPGTFALVRCTICDLVRLSPRPSPESLARYYPPSYYAYSADGSLPAYQRSLQTLLAPFRELLRTIALGSLGYPVPRVLRSAAAGRIARLLDKSLVLQRVASYPWEVPPATPGGRMLDLGCGSGRYLASLEPLGWRVQGVDASADAAQSAAEVFGIPVHVGSLETAPVGRGELDFIHMRHVIEHLEDPMDTLRHAFELLRPGGWLYIETPNIESYPAALCGRYWFGIDSPRHLWLFGPETLARSLQEAGFELDRMWSVVVIRLCSWESTYRREERASRLLRWRPSVGVRDAPRALWISVRTRTRVHTDRLSGDIIGCWARKPV